MFERASQRLSQYLLSNVFKGRQTQSTSDKEMATNPDEVGVNSSRQIIAELLMSAGPRKQNDSGLGEDAGGLLLNGDRCFYWISDGTSETAILENKDLRVDFSSRRLAQELGESFRLQIVYSDVSKANITLEDKVIGALLIQSMNAVMLKWSSSLDEVLRADKSFLDKAFDSAVTDNMEFSSTFQCGVLTSNGILQVGCFGDSPFLIKKKNRTHLYRPKNFRFFMRLNREDNLYSFTTSNEFAIEEYSFDEITFVAAGSDGVGRLLEFVHSMGPRFTFTRIRNKFSWFMPNTHDDKTLCILSLENY